MLQHMEAACPECPGGRLWMDIEVDERGIQLFPDGAIMRELRCEACRVAVLVTLNGAGNELTLIPVPVKH